MISLILGLPGFRSMAALVCFSWLLYRFSWLQLASSVSDTQPHVAIAYMGKLPGFSECSPSAMSIYSSTFLVGLPPRSLLHYRTGITVYTHGDDDWLTDPETEHGMARQHLRFTPPSRLTTVLCSMRSHHTVVASAQSTSTTKRTCKSD